MWAKSMDLKLKNLNINIDLHFAIFMYNILSIVFKFDVKKNPINNETKLFILKDGKNIEHDEFILYIQLIMYDDIRIEIEQLSKVLVENNMKEHVLTYLIHNHPNNLNNEEKDY